MYFWLHCWYCICRVLLTEWYALTIAALTYIYIHCYKKHCHFPSVFSHSQPYTHCPTLTVCVWDCGEMDWQMPPSGLPPVSAV